MAVSLASLPLFRPTGASRLIWGAILMLTIFALLYNRRSDLSALRSTFVEAKEASFPESPITQWGQDNDRASCPSPSDTPLPSGQTDPGMAKAITPTELMCRTRAADLRVVPKVIHQSWKTKELPAKFKKWSEGCRSLHPDWEWVLWSDDDNLALVRRFFPWLEHIYTTMPGGVYRADLMRNLYMYMFGGLYIDLDTDCLRSTSHLLDEYKVTVADGPRQDNGQVAIFGGMGHDDNDQDRVPNAWMLSTPGHPFFFLPLMRAREEVERKEELLGQGKEYHPARPEEVTGPVVLLRSMEMYNARGLAESSIELANTGPFGKLSPRKDRKVILLPEFWVYPYSWRDTKMDAKCSAISKTFDPEACKLSLDVKGKGSITITYWSHTHSFTEANKENIDRISS